MAYPRHNGRACLEEISIPASGGGRRLVKGRWHGGGKGDGGRGKEKRGQDDKPDSVRPKGSRPQAGDHSSNATDTRNCACAWRGPRLVPYLVLHRKGLALPPLLAERRGGLLPRRFTLAEEASRRLRRSLLCCAILTTGFPRDTRPFNRASCPAVSGLSSPEGSCLPRSGRLSLSTGDNIVPVRFHSLPSPTKNRSPTPGPGGGFRAVERMGTLAEVVRFCPAWWAFRARRRVYSTGSFRLFRRMCCAGACPRVA